MTVERQVDAEALDAFRGNRYLVPTGLVRYTVEVRGRLGATNIEILSEAGLVVATHRLRSPRAGQVVRDPQHRAALEAVGLDAFTADPPCRRKANRPPGERARAQAAKLLAALDRLGDVVVHLAAYARRRREPEGGDGMSNPHATYQLVRSHLAFPRLNAAAETPGVIERRWSVLE